MKLPKRVLSRVSSLHKSVRTVGLRTGFPYSRLSRFGLVWFLSRNRRKNNNLDILGFIEVNLYITD